MSPLSDHGTTPCALDFRSTSVADISRQAGVSGSLAYAYFDGKEALFRSALNHDAAEVIQHGVAGVLEAGTFDTSWQEQTFVTLIETVEEHPLTRRVLAGLEPHVTAEMLALPALNDLRSAVTHDWSSGRAPTTRSIDFSIPVRRHCRSGRA